LSTMSICSIEEVAEASPAPFWFQLYVMKDKGMILLSRYHLCISLLLWLLFI
jgi:hypothetical protein